MTNFSLAASFVDDMRAAGYALLDLQTRLQCRLGVA